MSPRDVFVNLGPNPDNLGRQIALTGKVVREWFNGVMAGHGASLHTWIILHHGLDRKGLSQRELARLLGIEGPTLVRHLDRLEAEGLLERRRDTRDRRVVRIVVTPAGQRRLAELQQVARQANARFDAVLSPAEQQQLMGLLRRVRTHFSSTGFPSTSFPSTGFPSTTSASTDPSPAEEDHDQHVG